jgi:hypothetical protein
MIPKRIQLHFDVATEDQAAELSAAWQEIVSGKRTRLNTAAEDTNKIMERARTGLQRIVKAVQEHPGTGQARRAGTGMASPRYLPCVRLVRAFNAINSGDLASKAHRPGEPIAIPLAVAQRLVRDAGFEPVVVGSLSRAREFDVGTPVYTRRMTAPQLRQALGLK